MKPTISIIIVHYKAFASLAKCLCSLAQIRNKEKIEIIIVNNNERNRGGTNSHLSYHNLPLIIIQSKKNLGFGGGNNLGAKEAQGKYLFFLNPDTIVKNNAPHDLADFLEKNPRTAIVSPTLLKANGQRYKIQGARKLTPLSAIFSYSFIHALWPTNSVATHHLLKNTNFKKNRSVDAVPGSTLMIRTKVFEEVSGFDESFFLYFEEHDLCKRVKETGSEIYLLAKPKVIHSGEASTKTLKKSPKNNFSSKDFFNQSRFYFLKKHYGWPKALITNFILNISKWHFLLMGIIGIYVGLMLSILNWGLPNLAHPFPYHMDEWHQLKATQATFSSGTPNVPGSAHSVMWHFILTGIFLGPFYLLKIIDPFAVSSSVSDLLLQQRIFQVLRLNTIIFGSLAIIFIYLILKKQFKINPFWGILFFVFNPIWLSLSNYFKYDIALIFWLSASLWALFNFSQKTSSKNYLMAGVLSALTFATKISAGPILFLYLSTFFIFQKNWKRNLKKLFSGFGIFCITFLSVGIPNIFIDLGKWQEFFISNLVKNPSTTDNFSFGKSWWEFIFVDQWILMFGKFFFIFLIFSLIFWVSIFIKLKWKEFKNRYPGLLIVGLALVFFSASLIPLRLFAGGNRSLILLPMMIILIATFIDKVLKKFKPLKKILVVSLILILTIQITEALTWVGLKWEKDPHQLSSAWISKNIEPGTTIGIENVPIYGRPPNLVLKEFYLKEYGKDEGKNLYNYKLVSSESEKLPSIIILTLEEITAHQKTSPQKELKKRMVTENYKLRAEFKPKLKWGWWEKKEFDFYITNLVPTSSIAIYQLP